LGIHFLGSLRDELLRILGELAERHSTVPIHIRWSGQAIDQRRREEALAKTDGDMQAAMRLILEEDGVLHGD